MVGHSYYARPSQRNHQIIAIHSSTDNHVTFVGPLEYWGLKRSRPTELSSGLHSPHHWLLGVVPASTDAAKMAALLLPSWLLLGYLVIPSAAVNNKFWQLPDSSQSLANQLQVLVGRFRYAYPQITQGKLNIWEMVQVAVLCSLLPGLWYLRQTRQERKSSWATATSWSKSQVTEQEGGESNGMWTSFGGRVTEANRHHPQMQNSAIQDC